MGMIVLYKILEIGYILNIFGLGMFVFDVFVGENRLFDDDTNFKENLILFLMFLLYNVIPFFSFIFYLIKTIKRYEKINK